MSLGNDTWNGRKKRITRRMAHDVRLLLPLFGLAGCLALYATAIFAAERLPAAPFDLPAVSAPRVTEAACDPVESQSASASQLGPAGLR